MKNPIKVGGASSSPLESQEQDARITAQAEKLETLHTHKRGLMQQFFPAPQGRAA